MNVRLAPAREVLDNGAAVIAKETTTTPAVTLVAQLRAGAVHDPAGQDGLAHFLSRTIDRGTERHSADELAEGLEGRGVSLATAISRHTLTLSCTCLAEDFVDVLGLVAEILVRPALPAVEVETRRGEIITLIRQDEDNSAVMAVESLMSLLYGAKHPYGRRLRGSTGSVAALDRQALLQFHARHCVPAGLCLAIVGAIESSRAIDAVHAALGGWAGPPFAETLGAPFPAAASRRCHVVSMMNKSQTDVAYGFATIARGDASYDAYWLMNNILGQFSLGGRLGDSIREQQGMAYYVFSSLEANLMPGPLVIRAGVSAANVPRAIASIDAELRKLAATGPTAQELAESKQYLIGSLARALETNMGIATYLQTVEFFGLGLDYDVRMPHLLQAVTLEQVHEAARHIVPDRATVVVAGPFEGPLS